MTAVSNTSPLNDLVLIDLQDILPVLFGRVLIPAAVRRELESHAAPEPIRRWMAAGATWLETRPVSDVSVDLEPLGAGEREAIRLAEVTETAVVLLDEKKARRIARDRGLVVSGTLGVLDFAARRGLLDLPAALDRLERTTFRASPRLLRLVRERHSARRS
jgi:predicted nucleic acid-binding protein